MSIQSSAPPGAEALPMSDVNLHVRDAIEVK